MNHIVSIVIGLIFAYIVYLGICQKGFIFGYVLNFVYCFISYYLQNPEITIMTFATVFLMTTIITIVEYIAYQKTQSFLGYIAYIVVMIGIIFGIIFLTKTLFAFLANPATLLK